MDFEKTVTSLNKTWGWINRIAGFASAGLLVLYCVLSFSSLTTMPINESVLMFYYLFFAALLLGSEFKFDMVLNNFGFLGNFFGKGLFVLAIGLSMFGGDAPTLKVVLAIVLVILGGLFIVAFIIPRKVTDSQSDKYADNAPAAGTRA